MLNILKVDKEVISSSIDKLLTLQDIRQNLNYLSKEINILKDDLEKEEAKYENKKFQYNKNLPYLQKTEKEYAEIREEIVNVKERIEQCEEKKKKIKTIKEFKALNKEIDNLNQENGIKENQLLDKSEDLEYKKEKMKKTEDNLREMEENLEIKKKQLLKIVKERKSDIREETEKREKIEKELDPSLVVLFNRIYSNNEKTALARVEKYCCTGCNTVIPKQITVNVKKLEDFIFCPSCSQILYYEDEEN